MGDSDDPFAKLTEREKECLRLVAGGRTAKEIAIALSIAPDTVYQHLKKTLRKLGASSSAQAATMLAEHEAGRHPQDWGPRPQPLPTPSPPGLAGRLSRWFPLPAWRQPGGGNELNRAERFRETLYVLLLSVFALGVAVSGIAGLGQIARSLYQNTSR